jgi:hypothetical protein
MVSNRKLNRAMLIMAVVLNSFLVWVYWTYAPIVLAEEEEGAKITFFEDRTFTIQKNMIRIQGDYIFTNLSFKEIEYTQEGLKFKNNGMVIMR